MKKIVKLVHVNDGEKNEVNNGDFLLVENYPRTEKIISAFLSEGWTLNSITQQVTPAVQKQGAYTFYMGGFNLLFEKEEQYPMFLRMNPGRSGKNNNSPEQQHMDSLLAVSRFPAGGIFLRDTPGRRLTGPCGQAFAGGYMQRIKKILPHRILYFIRKNQRHSLAGIQLRKI